MVICRYNHIMKNELLQLQVDVFRAFTHPLRLKILEKLRSGACCVCRIIPYVGGEQSNVSHHLAILRRAGIVRSKKKGLEVWYEVTDLKIFEIMDYVKEYLLDSFKKTSNILQELSDER